MNSLFLRSILSFILLIVKGTGSSVKISQGRESTIHIDLDAIEHNYQQLLKKLPPNHPVMAVVKANAYGVGAVAVAKTVLELGAKYLAVAFVDEGVHLRKHGIDAPILVLGYTAAGDEGIELAIRYSLTITVFTKEVLDAIQLKAWHSQCRVKIHIKVNTGMNRIGLEPDQLVPFVQTIKNGFYTAVELEGVFSHFASLDYPFLSEPDKQYARNQLKIFKRVVNLARKVMRIPIAHIASSNSIEFFGKEGFLDMVRPGSSINGFMPFARPALSLTSIVSAIRKPAKGQQLGYEENVTATGDDWIAGVLLGFADGLSRDCSNGRREVLIKGVRVPIVTRIMMDQMLVNVTIVYPVAVEEKVVIIGRQGQEEITAEDIAKMCGGSATSVTSQLSTRIPRVYYQNGRMVYYENNLLMY
ncbi:alanine racemase 2-like [Bradysia coprophila]|uniref:alanine racemase 2-like n=1 Tax=Bradysia coprophila TaxID=38358 RepID=UPI00187D8703|nr:alanine racemase 2-like [Bradysia coprophila]